ncbi:ESSS subunit of NADH:ubiquinone oxidoreductase [Umbelopsis sp. PMI_123]|nr:ESSS subunit of NADH:ubiquinone oxidoreductase [Umbelopsis sp. PMI_123]
MSMFARAFARSSAFKRAAIRRGGHGPASYNEPGGYLFNEKPLAPGQKRIKEDWESIYYWGMGGGFALISALLYYKPDTSVVTWATKEAEKSLKEKGVSLEYPKSA